MNKKIRELRKALNLTMEKFGEKLGVGKTAISKLENGERNLTDQMLKAICNVNWNGKYVNEDWLHDTSNKMFKKDSDNELDALAEKYKMSNTEYVFLKEFFKLAPANRENFFETLDIVFSAIHKNDTNASDSSSPNIKGAFNLSERSWEEMSDEELGNFIRQQYKLQREATEKSEAS